MPFRVVYCVNSRNKDHAMYFIIGTPKTIGALNGHFDINVGKLRSQTKICIIDDEAFPKKNTLVQHEYQ